MWQFTVSQVGLTVKKELQSPLTLFLEKHLNTSVKTIAILLSKLAIIHPSLPSLQEESITLTGQILKQILNSRANCYALSNNTEHTLILSTQINYQIRGDLKKGMRSFNQ
jgi:hypothetical protein